MKIAPTVDVLSYMLDDVRKNHCCIGFVPTMGALHAGHLSLVKKAQQENDCVVVSVYVNPTQFNEPGDFNRYPRTLEQDILLLSQMEGAEQLVLFTPDDQQMYPEPDRRTFDFGKLEQVLEGAFRPGHFRGVAQVVSKLLMMVKPDVAYFGQKDYQQLLIIRKMTEMLSLPVQIVSCPIIREANGLAMSSRNERLNDRERQEASLIYETLRISEAWMKKDPAPGQVRERAIQRINEHPLFRVEYFEIVDRNSLMPTRNMTDLIACVAVFARDVRLIDNWIYDLSD